MEDPEDAKVLNYQPRASSSTQLRPGTVVGAVVGMGVLTFFALTMMAGGMVIAGGIVTGNVVRREVGVVGMLMTTITFMIGILATLAGAAILLWAIITSVRTMNFWFRGGQSSDAHAEGWK